MRGLENLLNIDTNDAFRGNRMLRAGFVNSGVSAFNRIMERQTQDQGFTGEVTILHPTGTR